MSSPRADISENDLLEQYPAVLGLLLIDKTTGKNILWATDGYADRGAGYAPVDHITVSSITGDNGDVIQPRTYKARQAQSGRTKDKAEVFTPAWVVNLQNNAVDDAWLGYEGAFNTTSEDNRTWQSTTEKIEFPDKAADLDQAQDRSLKTWQSYVCERRMEITCGEAPYLASRYDAAGGRAIPIKERVGMLDRKLRVIEENVLPDHDHEQLEWFEWVKKAYQSVYGFEWQGDNLLIARENLLFTFFDVYRARYGCDPDPDDLAEIAEIIAWNLFQMDGLKYVVPDSCGKKAVATDSLFDEESEETVEECVGCLKNDPARHNGDYAKIKYWDSGEVVRFFDILG